MFYRRKYYIVKSDFVGEFNRHFNQTNLPNQLKHGARLVGRWMKDNGDNTHEIFAIWEYDSYEDYVEIESKVRGDMPHVQRVKDWYEKNGGKDYILKNHILEVRNEALESTVEVTR
ncbi:MULTISPECIES: NIPSNAP family protein [Bacillaceae]|uniref:NIPSNAP family protein n=1 Tax=Evansella alkalicola TaxID=745819 RepID=A0ABS6JVX5_9BACI|nr:MULTISPECIES: NIPSNAP family protein [Bacillaceae]MBU9722735.1 NIPSNAP family protein [Bacillus alkalicola]